MMKRLLAFILAAMMLLACLAGCASSSADEEVEEDEVKGAEIQMFLTTLPESIDPSASYTAADTVRIMGLLYEGLTTIDEDGNLEKALAADWEYEIDERDGLLKLEITLANSRWSDGIIVDVDDFIYAWSRILLPENKNANASLLYPILNAREVKEGLCSVNDLGVYAIKDNVMQIVFEPSFANEDDFSKSEIKKNVEYFMRRLASPALVPLREDVASKLDWNTVKSSTFITNGPFKIKSWNTGELTFERSVYYRCVSDSESNADDKVVKPYRIITLYTDGKSATNHYEKFTNEQSFYINLNSASDEVIENIKKKDIESDNLLSTYCLYLDSSHELFANPEVRKALSLALDRAAIAESVMAEPATGFVPEGVEDTKKGTSFRKEGGDVISAKANLEEAKKIIAAASPKAKMITIEYSNLRDDEERIAKACQAAWTELGFRVTIGDKTQVYIDRKENGEYSMNLNNEEMNIASVVAMNLQSMTNDAYSILSTFSSKFGGTFVDVTTGPSAEDVVYGNHVTGFADAEYDAIVEKFVNATDSKTRSAAMHEAEEYLAEKMPVIPVVFNKANYITQKLSKYETDFFGRLNFTELKQKNFEKYLETEEE